MKRLAPFFFVLALAGCATVMLPKLTPSQLRWAGGQWSGVDAASMESARVLYVNRCSGCHNLVTPDKHTPEEWDVLLNRMAPRAKLTADEKEAVHRFILSAKQPG
jgi:hypothetical protein